MFPPIARPKPLAGRLVLEPVAKQYGQVGTQWLRILPAVLTVSRLDRHRGWRCVQIERLGGRAGHLLSPESGEGSHRVEHGPIRPGRNADGFWYGLIAAFGLP